MLWAFDLKYSQLKQKKSISNLLTTSYLLFLSRFAFHMQSALNVLFFCCCLKAASRYLGCDENESLKMYFLLLLKHANPWVFATQQDLRNKKNVLQHLIYFPLPFWLTHCCAPLFFKGYSHFIYSKTCQAKALWGDDRHSNSDSTQINHSKQRRCWKMRRGNKVIFTVCSS